MWQDEFGKVAIGKKFNMLPGVAACPRLIGFHLQLHDFTQLLVLNYEHEKVFFQRLYLT